MPKITSVKGRLLYNSRGSKTIEVDIVSDNRFLGRVCAPSGASVGKHEVVNFPDGKPENSLQILNNNLNKFLDADPSNLKSIHEIIRDIDQSDNYARTGGALALSVTIAALEAAAKA